MAAEEPRPASLPGPCLNPEAPATPAVLPVRLARDGSTWRIGTDAEVAWIASGTSVSRTITAAIPPVFEAYATVVLPDGDEEREQRDLAVSALLSEHSPGQPWWLGYLDTGVDDIVFPGAPMVTLYSGWHYVLVEAGPEQAGRHLAQEGLRVVRCLAQLDIPRRSIVARFHAVGRRLELYRRTRWTRGPIPAPRSPPGQAGRPRPRRHATRPPGAVTRLARGAARSARQPCALRIRAT